MDKNELTTIEALSEGFEMEEGGFVFHFGEGYQLCIEPLRASRAHVALYKGAELMTNKLKVKIGKL